MKQELVWILIVATFIAGFFLLQGTMTGYVIADTTPTILTDIQLHSTTPISPTLEITIPIKQLTETTPELTYGYIQIKPITENFTYADILFKVSTSWITNNNLDKSDIALYRFTDNNWEQLPTEIEKEPTEYKARTPELGLFAIAKATEKLHIEEPAIIEKPTKPITPVLTLIIIILTIILTAELLTLLRNKLRFILILLAFATMILGLTIQQPVTKDILTFGLLPLSIIAFTLSFALTITLNKLRKHKLYPYIRNIIIAILAVIISIISSTVSYNKDTLIYGVLPLIAISIIASSLATLIFHINSNFKKNTIYANIRNIILSLVLILIIIKLLSKTIYYLKTFGLMITYLSIKLFQKPPKKKRKSKP